MKSLAFGEVLWDIFDSRREIGGAPFNFSAHLSRLGISSYIATAVGRDVLGEETLKYMENYGVFKTHVQIVDKPTGTCVVSCDDSGQPKYEITQPAAWDYIDEDKGLVNKVVNGEFDLFYFGTLALRSRKSFSALEPLVKRGSYKHVFCDLNLRQNFYNKETIEFALKFCSILKLNREELLQLIKERIINASQKHDDYKLACKQLSQKYAIEIILLTLDKDGAMVYESENDRFYITSKPQNKAVSCVGAGDSFSACFISNYLNGYPIDECAERAVLLSDYVVTQYGAVPDYPTHLINAVKP